MSVYSYRLMMLAAVHRLLNTMEIHRQGTFSCAAAAAVQSFKTVRWSSNTTCGWRLL